jgi:hypothetical protein
MLTKPKSLPVLLARETKNAKNKQLRLLESLITKP